MFWEWVAVWAESSLTVGVSGQCPVRACGRGSGVVKYGAARRLSGDLLGKGIYKLEAFPEGEIAGFEGAEIPRNTHSRALEGALPGWKPPRMGFGG